MITTLPDADNVVTPEPFANADHPMRKVTRQVAFDGAWDSARAAKIGALFDGLAPDWAKRQSEPDRQAVLIDCVERGGLDVAGRWLECGSGSGVNTVLLAAQVAEIVAFDLSKEMLAVSPPEAAPRVQGDSSRIPFGDDSFDVIVLVNMLLFPAELDRVLAPGGSIAWVNTIGDQTPIHLPVDDVMKAMPGEWTGTTAQAGSGFWLTLSRSI